jgi:predicted DNA-binding protein
MVVRASERKGMQQPTSVRLPVSLMRRLEAAASKDGRSLSSEITSRLEQSFEREDVYSAVGELLSLGIVFTGPADVLDKLMNDRTSQATSASTSKGTA